jgi:hypothetical protein
MPLQVAFMTGQSNPSSCALSPVQDRFLDALPVPESARVRCNFPYLPDPLPHRHVPLARASWHNMRLYVASRDPAFADRHRPTVLRMLMRADRTVLLAGSCGLELLANLRLPEPSLDRVHVFAYGAVARRRPAIDLFTVRGRKDWIARCWGGQIDVTVKCGHMTYLEAPEVLALCKEFVAHVSGQTGSVS